MRRTYSFVPFYTLLRHALAAEVLQEIIPDNIEGVLESLLLLRLGKSSRLRSIGRHGGLQLTGDHDVIRWRKGRKKERLRGGMDGRRRQKGWCGAKIKPAQKWYDSNCSTATRNSAVRAANPLRSFAPKSHALLRAKPLQTEVGCCFRSLLIIIIIITNLDRPGN